MLPASITPIPTITLDILSVQEVSKLCLIDFFSYMHSFHSPSDPPPLKSINIAPIEFLCGTITPLSMPLLGPTYLLLIYISFLLHFSFAQYHLY